MVLVWHTLVRPTSPVLEVQYPIVHGKVNRPATEDIIIIRPHSTQRTKTKQRFITSMTTFNKISNKFLCICLSVNPSFQISLYLSVFVSISYFLHLYFFLFISQSLSAWLSVWLSVCLSVRLCVCLPVCLSLCLSVCMYVCMYLCMSVWLSVCLSGYLSVWLSACLSLLSSIRIVFWKFHLHLSFWTGEMDPSDLALFHYPSSQELIFTFLFHGSHEVFRQMKWSGQI